jgi:DNA polymerase-3 subunit delta'
MARILDEIRGHQAPLQQFLKAHQDGRLASTFLLVGPSGIGKRKAALGFAQALLCDTSTLGCGACGPCLRVAKGASESLLMVAPEGTQIKVEQGREILEFLSLQRLGKARVVIIDQAQLLNVQAGNALLKTLEEPPEHTYLFLIASSQAAVLPTIRSRSQVLRFSPLSDADLRALVQAPEWVVAASQGRVELAQILSDGSWAEVREQALLVLRRSIAGEAVETQAIKDVTKDKLTALFSVLMWQKFLRDEWLEATLEKPPMAALPWLLEKACELEGPIHGNVDRTLLIENFLLHARHLSHLTHEDILSHALD